MPTYRVTINGTTYRVNSDKELSDVQAYQYAQQQAAATPAPASRAEAKAQGKPRSTATKVTGGLRDIARGIADVPDFMASIGESITPVDWAARGIDALAGTNLRKYTNTANPNPTRLVNAVDIGGDVVGAGRSEEGSDTEKLVGSGIRGASSALVPIPGAAVTKAGRVAEALAGASSGASSELARQMGGNQAVQVGAGLVGGIAPGALVSGAKNLAGAGSAYTKLRKPTERAMRRMQNAASDPAAAARAIEGRAPASPGTAPTMAEVAEDSGLAAFQRSKQSTRVLDRERANAQRRAATADISLGPGKPQAVQDVAAGRVQAGEEALMQAQQRVGPATDRATTGETTRAQFKAGHDAAKARTRAAYNVPELKDPTPIPLDQAQAQGIYYSLRDRADDFYGDAGGRAPGKVQDTVHDLLTELGADNINTRTIANVDRRLADFAGRKRVSGAKAEAAFAESLREGLDNLIGPYIPQPVKDALANAKAARRTQSEMFERGRVGRAMSDKQFGPSVTDVELPGQLVRPGAAGGSTAEGLIRALGPEASEAAVRQELRRLVDEGKISTPAQVQQYRELTSRFPGLQNDLNAIQAQVAQNAEFAGSQLGGLANAGNDPAATVSKLLSAKDGGRGFNDLMRDTVATGDVAAINGLRRSVAQHIREAGASGQFDAAGAAIPSASNTIKAIDNVLERTGDLLSKKQQDVLKVIRREMASTKFAGAAGYVMPEKVDTTIPAVTGVTARTLRFLFGWMDNAKQVDALIEQAILDPDTAKDLLGRPTPDRLAKWKRTLGRSARGAAAGVAQTTNKYPDESGLTGTVTDTGEY